MKHNIKKMLLLLTALIAVLALTGCGSKNKIDLQDYIHVEPYGVSGYGDANAYIDNAGLEALVLSNSKDGESELEQLAKLELVWNIKYELDKSENLSNGDKITVTVTYSSSLAEVLDAEITPKSGESWTVEVSGLEELHEYDVFADLDVTFEGYNGYGKPKVQINGGTLVGWVFSQEEGLSNGDTITMTLTGPDGTDLMYYCTEEDFVPSAESKEFTVTGLAEAPLVDLFEDIDIVVEGTSPFMSIFIRGKYEDKDIGYELVEEDLDGRLAIGDIVTIRAYGAQGLVGRVDLAERCMGALNSLPAAETYTYTIPETQEYYLLEQAQLTEDILAQAVAEAKDHFDAEAKAEELVIQSVSYYGYYLQTLKDMDDYGDPCRLYILHEVQYILEGKAGMAYNVVQFNMPYVDKDGVLRADSIENMTSWMWEIGEMDLYFFDQRYITPEKAKYNVVTGK